MVELTEWRKSLVVQKDSRHGSIAAGFEWMIRFNKVKGVNLETFQDDFNLKAGAGENNFQTISEAVKEKYAHINIKHQNFKQDQAMDKVKFVKKLVSENIPSMLSLTLSSKKSITHEMPITSYDDNYMRFVWRVGDKNNPDLLRVGYDDILIRHRDWDEGKAIAWLEPLA